MAGGSSGCADSTGEGGLFSAALSTAVPVRSNCSRRYTLRVSSAICCLNCWSSSDCRESVTLWHQWLRLRYAKVKTRAKSRSMVVGQFDRLTHYHRFQNSRWKPPHLCGGKERFSAPEKAQRQSCALALDRETEAEAYLNNGNSSAGLKSSSPC